MTPVFAIVMINGQVFYSLHEFSGKGKFREIKTIHKVDNYGNYSPSGDIDFHNIRINMDYVMYMEKVPLPELEGIFGSEIRQIINADEE